MGYDFQVVVDCAQPHRLADWWAQAMRWDVEPSNEEQIRGAIAAGQATEEDTTTHNGVLVWRVGAAIRDGDRRVLFQVVPEPKSTKNRVHLDVRVGKENVEAEAERLTALGATFLHRGQQGPFSWITMADAEGNEFCIT